MNQNHYRFNTRLSEDFPALCANFTGKALQSPYRSTVPLLDLVEHGNDTWRGLLATLGIPVDAPVHFEYCVPSPIPGGNPSQTDAVILSETDVWMIEAKWTEPPDKLTVEKRIIRESDKAIGVATIAGWLNHLQAYASHPLKPDDFRNVTYQIVHRAASACAVAKERESVPHVVYLHFDPSPLKNTAATAMYERDIAEFHALLGAPSGLTFDVVELPLCPEPAFEAIKDLDKHSPSTSTRVKEALCAGPLFSFGEPRIHRI
jgi:hypothetical protein